MDNQSLLPEPLALCGGSIVKRMLRQLRDIPQLARRRDVLLSTDCGADCDDQAVVAYLAVHREVRLIGIISSFAPNVAAPFAKTTAAHVQAVLDTLPLKHQRPQVVVGSNHPLLEMTSADVRGADYIIQASKAYSPSDRLTIVLIGPATDVAAALQRDPTLEDRIEVVAMAFDQWPQGNDPWNVKNDVWAWQSLLETTTPVTIGDGNICRRHLSLTREQAPHVFRGEVGKHLCKGFLDFTAAHPAVVEKMSGKAGTWPVWDLVTVAHLLGYTQSVLLPRPVLQDDTSFEHLGNAQHALPEDTNEPHIRWITALDSETFWRDLTALFDEAGYQTLTGW
jgi:inosine-uridine nucleoside N-ribohydrolase